MSQFKKAATYDIIALRMTSLRKYIQRELENCVIILLLSSYNSVLV